jgi:hypothetical protein
MNAEEPIPESNEPLPEPTLIHGQVTISNGPVEAISAPVSPEAPEALPSARPALAPVEPPRRALPAFLWVAVVSLVGNFVLAGMLWFRAPGPAKPASTGAQAAPSTPPPPQGSPEAFQAALKPYLDAAQAGDTSAMRMLGAMYYHGLDLPRNREEGLKWYRKAAGSGSKVAQEELRQLE